jgi:hypothetical protein
VITPEIVCAALGATRARPSDGMRPYCPARQLVATAGSRGKPSRASRSAECVAGSAHTHLAFTTRGGTGTHSASAMVR